MYLITNSSPGQFVFFVPVESPEGTTSVEQLTIIGNNIPTEIPDAMAKGLEKDPIFNWYKQTGILTLTAIASMPEEAPAKTRAAK
jgi:hypothetical protein